MEAIAVGLAADAAALITKAVTARVKEEVWLAVDHADEFEKLKERWLYIQAFLNDLGNANHIEKSRLVNVWLEKVKEVAYSTDELMDDYAYEMLRRKHDDDEMKLECSPNEMMRLFWPIVFHFQMAHRVKQIMSQLDKLDKEAKQIGLKLVDLATKAVSAPSASSYSSGDYKGDTTLSQIRERPPTHLFIGREDDQNKLLQMLCNPTRIGVLAGSVILITTRNDKVAKAACASDVHKLKGLSEDDGWALLKQQVCFDCSLDDVAKRILDKCKGVPLAIKAIGSILQSTETPYDWYRIEASGLWDIQQNHEDKNYIMPSLLLSYNHFKHVSLKRCFALCAIFPKDMVMKKAQLIYLWLAQGLLYDEYKFGTYSTTTTAETIGEKYIDTLVNHSFLLEEEDEGSKTKYKMHDLVHDLATYVSNKDLLLFKVGDKIEDVDFHLQHLAFNLSGNEIAPEILTKMKLSNLRTISFWGGVPRWNSLISAQYVHTLIVVGTRLKEVPLIIEKFVHLRYLDLSSNEMKALPESLCKLYQLHTLRLFDCENLEELPRGLHKLENLRHIETSSYLWASKGLGQLASLQTLPRLKLRDGEGWMIDELGPLDQVKGEIHIQGLEHVKNTEKAREVGLDKKDKIVKLNLKWSRYREESCGVHSAEDVLQSLGPHPNIQSMTISGYPGVRFPMWLRTSVKHLQLQRGLPTQLYSLIKLKLVDCENCRQLPSLGQLPNLKFLYLNAFNAVECIGEEFYESNSKSYTDELHSIPTICGTKRKVMFPSLTELCLENFRTLATWDPPSTPTATLPKLETLRIRGCPNLRKIPTSLEECTSLQCLLIRNCPLIGEGEGEGEGSIPDISKLQHLTELVLDYAGKMLPALLQWILHFHRLSKLEICGLREEWDITLISSLTFLRILSLRESPNFKPLTAQQLVHPSSTL
ncbi:putative disease resistance RPP13-like protein 1 [Bienertia sinuspersici]